MADNVGYTPGSGALVASDEVTYSGDTSLVQLMRPVVVSGSEGSKTVVDLPGDNTNGLDVDVTRVKPDGTNTMPSLDIASRRGYMQVTDGSNSLTVSAQNAALVAGDVAHDTADAGNPQKIGAKAIAHGTNPTAVAAGDRTDLYANRAGVLFTIGGHPNVTTRSVRVADADGAQTNASMVGTIATGTKVAVTAMAVTCDQANTGAVAVKVGFGATAIPADSLTGADGILLDHDGIAPGSGIVVGSGAGILGIGADGEELRLTCEDPVGGSVVVTFSYFTIES